MPYKDPERKKAHNKSYYLSRRDDLKLKRRKRYKQKNKTESVQSPKSVQSQNHINVHSQDDEKSPTLDDLFE